MSESTSDEKSSKPSTGKYQSDGSAEQAAPEVGATPPSEAQQNPKAGKKSKAEQKPKTVQKNQGGKKSSGLLLVALLATLAVGFWLGVRPVYLQMTAAIVEIERVQQGMFMELAGTRSRLDQLAQRLAADQQAGDQQIEEVSLDLRNEMNALAARLREVESSRSGDWIVAEVEYLVRLASQRLLTGRDAQGAVRLLREADQLLFDLGYPEAREARSALAGDITRLENLGQIDYQGIYFRISALISLVDGLPLPEINRLAADAAEQPGWRGWLGWIASRLQDLVIIRRDDSEARMLSSEQALLQKMRLQILLHEAQLALLSGNTSIYRGSLDRALQLAQEVFSPGPNLDSLTRQMGELSARQISLEVPEITASLRAVDELGRVLRTGTSGTR